MPLIFIFIFGLIIGSFLNCVIFRLEGGRNTLSGRSFCPDCKHKLSWKDLIPVFSFIFLKRKCRYCQKKISWQYPIVELMTGIGAISIINYQFSIFPLLADQPLAGNEFSIFNYQTIISTLFLFAISCLLIVIFVFDLKHFIIPDSMIFSAIGVTILYRLFETLIHNSQFIILSYLGSALGAMLFFLAICLFSKGKWMGFGDVKLAFFMGLFLGFPNIVVGLFLAFLFGAIIGVGLIFLKKKNLKSEVPFGPFLIIGTAIAFIWGESLVNWYLKFFGIQ